MHSSAEEECTSSAAFQGGAVAIQAALAKEKGVKLCMWPDENKKQTKARLYKDNLEHERQLLSALHDIFPPLIFRRSDMKGALKSLCKTYRKTWKLDKGQETEFVDTVACRIQNLLRVVSQAEVKKSTPDWLLAMPWRSGDAKPDGARAKKRPASLGIGARFYGYDAEVGLGYRVELGGEKVMSLPPTIPDEANDFDVVVGQWPDGEQRPIPGLTCERLRDLSRPKQHPHR